MKTQELIKRPRHAKTEEAEPKAGAEPAARAGTEELRGGEPGTAAQHAAAAVALPAVLRPLKHIPDHVRQPDSVGAIGADRARALTATIKKGVKSPAASCSRPGRRTIPRRPRRPAQPGHIRLRVVPAHARHRMTIRLPIPGVPPRIRHEKREPVTPRHPHAARRPRAQHPPGGAAPSAGSAPAPGTPRSGTAPDTPRSPTGSCCS